ncbi:MAG: periplasmic heavy metal sensor [Candidatus Omnitrophica bacterium]|nr:periplasmic heavy metal sensor [Candidatus Omnitrophota bacterium]
MERKIKTFFLSLGMVFFLGFPLYAREPFEPKQHREGEPRWKKLAKILNLTEEQQQKLEENSKKQREKTSELFKALKEEHRKLRKELERKDVRKEDIRPIVDNIKSLQAKLLEQKIEGIFAVKEILTPEQFTKFQEISQKRMKHKERDWRKSK